MRLLPLCAITAVVLVLAGCGSNSSVSSTHTPADITVSGGPASATTFAKADFIAQADAVCGATLKTLGAQSTPSGPDDFTAIVTDFTAAINAHTPFITNITALVNLSADKQQLMQNWIDLDQQDWAATLPQVHELIAAAQAHDASKTSTLLSAVDSYTGHGKQMQDYLTSYGLPTCAKLEAPSS